MNRKQELNRLFQIIVLGSEDQPMTLPPSMLFIVAREPPHEFLSYAGQIP